MCSTAELGPLDITVTQIDDSSNNQMTEAVTQLTELRAAHGLCSHHTHAELIQMTSLGNWNFSGMKSMNLDDIFKACRLN